MREFAERCKIIAHSPITVYIASYNPRYWYPYRIQHAGQAREWVRDESLSVIMDSGISDESIGNKETLDRAHELRSDYVIPADSFRDQSGTTAAISEFLDLYEDHPCSATPLLPLQPPFDRHYREFSEYSHFALGGIASVDPSEQVREIKRFREVAGDTVSAHGLGLGASLELIRALRDDPSLLDSLDLSTPEQMTINGQIADSSWIQRDFDYPRGEDSTTIRGAYASAMAIQLNYMLSPLCSDKNLESAYEQTQLSDLDQR